MCKAFSLFLMIPFLFVNPRYVKLVYFNAVGIFGNFHLSIYFCWHEVTSVGAVFYNLVTENDFSLAINLIFI